MEYNVLFWYMHILFYDQSMVISAYITLNIYDFFPVISLIMLTSKYFIIL